MRKYTRRMAGVLALVVATTTVSATGVIEISKANLGNENGSSMNANSVKTTTESAVDLNKDEVTTNGAVDLNKGEMVITVGVNGDYQTINAALESITEVPTEESRVTLLIEPGIYEEDVNVSMPYITFKNANFEGQGEVVITYDKAQGHSDPNKNETTEGSATVTIGKNANNFKAYGITFQNSYNLNQPSLGDDLAARAQSQAVAVTTLTDRIMFEGCKFIGRQDTLYLKGASKGQNVLGANEARVYLKDCYIEGTVDFIFGDATAVFDGCELMMAYYTTGGHFTAANTPLAGIGLVFIDCKLSISDEYKPYIDEATGTFKIGEDGKPVKKIDLGRPWQADKGYPYFGSHTAFINCQMDPAISSERWSSWDSNTITNKVRYMEYQSVDLEGNPIDLSNKLEWVRDLGDEQAEAYTASNLLRGSDGWSPTGEALSQETKVADLTLNTYQVELPVGGSVKIEENYLPANSSKPDCKWVNEDEDIAEVDASGNLVAKSEGVTRVYMSPYGDDYKVYVDVKVLPAKTEVPKVKEIAIESPEKILPGTLLQGSYTYEKAEDNALDCAKVQWYIVDQTTGEEILISEGKDEAARTHKVATHEIGYTYKFVVIPETETTYGEIGEKVASKETVIVQKPEGNVPELYLRESFKNLLDDYTNVMDLTHEVDTKWSGLNVDKQSVQIPSAMYKHYLGEVAGREKSAWNILDTSGHTEGDAAFNGNATLSANIDQTTDASILMYHPEKVWEDYNAEVRMRFSPLQTGYSSKCYWDMYICYNAETHTGYKLSLTRGSNTKSGVLSLYKVDGEDETLMAQDKTTLKNKLLQNSGEENPYFRIRFSKADGVVTGYLGVEAADTEVTLSFEDEAQLTGTIAFETYGKAGCPIMDLLTVEEILASEPVETPEPSPSEMPEPTMMPSPSEAPEPTTVPSPTQTPETENKKDIIVVGGNHKSAHSSSSVIYQSTQNEGVTKEEVTDMKPETATQNKVSTFNDLAQYTWAEEAIERLAHLEIIKGVGEGKFAPKSKVVRADAVVMLVRMMNELGQEIALDLYTGQKVFDDINSSAYYAPYVAVAKELGMVTGVNETSFAPKKNISRQDMVVLIAKALEAANALDLSQADLSLLDTFGDGKKVADYAQPAMAVMIQKGIITGSGALLRPKDQMTRAEAAVMMSRILEQAKAEKIN